jgi:hypothetical protein
MKCDAAAGAALLGSNRCHEHFKRCSHGGTLIGPAASQNPYTVNQLRQATPDTL